LEQRQFDPIRHGACLRAVVDARYFTDLPADRQVSARMPVAEDLAATLPRLEARR
jgi:hypothetical protein